MPETTAGSVEPRVIVHIHNAHKRQILAGLKGYYSQLEKGINGSPGNLSWVNPGSYTG